MLNVKLIKRLFKALNAELKKKDIIGELGICGGAVMCLVFKTRPATKDVDAVFAPSSEIRRASRKVAGAFGVPDDWLNDAAKAFFHSDPPREDVMNLSNLRVWAPTAGYMLAMKCISARYDSADADDVVFLIKYLDLKSPEQVFDIVSEYYPRKAIPARTQFFVEELFDN